MRAFVLGGGGGRGALQVGALRALFEAGFTPDLLVGTSVGAVNATYLAARGCTVEALADLESAWRAASRADLLPDNYIWITIRSLFGRGGTGLGSRMRDFFVSEGLDPELRFGQLTGPRLILVAANLNGCCTALFGADPTETVLDALLASTAIPPWVRPWPHGDQLLMDGGLVSNLPIEPALRHGATEIVALDLTDPRNAAPVSRGPGPFVFQLLSVIEHRQTELEVQLAAARGAPVHHIRLRGEAPVQVWQFDRPDVLFECGYALTRRYLADHPELSWDPVPAGRSRARRLWDRLGEQPLVARRPSLRTLHRFIGSRQA